MKILFLSPFLPYPENSGSKIRAMSLLLSLKDHDVYLVAFREQAEKVHEKELINIVAEFFVYQRPKISAYQRFLNHFSLKPFLSKRFYLNETEEKIREILRSNKIDVIIVETLLMAEYVRNLKNTYKILDEHNLEYIRASRRIKDCKGWAKKIYFYLILARLKRFELKTIRDFNRILVCSEVDRKTIERFFPTKSVSVIPNSIDTQYFSPGEEEPDSKKLIFTGTMWYEPNVDAVRFFNDEIFPLLIAEIPDIEFIIVGDNPTEEVLSLSKKDGVSVTCQVDDIRPYLSNASVFVAPIRMGSGTRLKILSAMSMGIPVVSTKIGCEGIEIKEGENICIADNPPEFRDKIIRLFKDKQFRDHIVRGGQKLVNEKYSRSVLTNGLAPFWREVELESIK